MTRTFTFALCLLASSPICAFDLAPGDILVSEFFEGLVHIDPLTGERTSIGIADGASDIALEPTGTLLVNESGDIHRIDINQRKKTSVMLDQDVRDFALDHDGNIVFANGESVSRFNVVTEKIDELKTAKFFNPRSVVVEPSGDIVFTEFFEGFWRIDQNGLGGPIPGTKEISFPDFLTIDQTGDLLVKDFENQILSVDRITGADSVVIDTEITFPSDMAIESDGNLLITSTDGIHRFDRIANEITLLATTTFFSPQGIAIVGEFDLQQVCGDWDFDGDVDSNDRTRLSRFWTGAIFDSSGGRTFDQGDCDGDGDVDSADLNGLVQNWTGAMFAQRTESAELSLPSVPEPAGWLAMLLGIALMLLRRGRWDRS